MLNKLQWATIRLRHHYTLTLYYIIYYPYPPIRGALHTDPEKGAELAFSTKIYVIALEKGSHSNLPVRLYRTFSGIRWGSFTLSLSFPLALSRRHWIACQAEIIINHTAEKPTTMGIIKTKMNIPKKTEKKNNL